MSTTQTTDTIVHKRKDQGEFQLLITVGHAQAGDTVVKYGRLGKKKEEVPEKQKGQYTIPASEHNKKMSLQCTTTVQDINPDTNNISVTYELKENDSSKEYSYEVSVKHHNDKAIFDIEFILL